MTADEKTRQNPGLFATLGNEGFRLFFLLAALYAALWPVLWVVLLGFDLPLVRQVPSSLWHAHEMLIGAFGVALIGFLTTAVPEWTDTRPLRGKALYVFFTLWAIGRLVGILDWDGAGILGALADIAWLCGLLGYVLKVSWERRTEQLLAFAFWLAILTICEAVMRWSFASDNIEVAIRASHIAGFAFLGLLGLALARISVPVTNLVLDPSEQTSPFRPHPGRRNLAPGLVLIVILGETAGVSAEISGYLFIAAGAAYLDRMAEGFVGRFSFRTEIIMLTGSAAFAGVGLMLIGATRLGAPWSEMPGLHLAFMGGLGLGVLAVLCIASLLHSDRKLGLSRATRIAALCLVASVALRVLPELGLIGHPPAPPYMLASILWACSFLIWLADFWPILRYLPAAAEQ